MCFLAPRAGGAVTVASPRQGSVARYLRASGARALRKFAGASHEVRSDSGACGRVFAAEVLPVAVLGRDQGAGHAAVVGLAAAALGAPKSDSSTYVGLLGTGANFPRRRTWVWCGGVEGGRGLWEVSKANLASCAVAREAVERGQQFLRTAAAPRSPQ